MTAMSQTDRPAARASEATRWSQLIIGIICMVMIANLQYGWTLFTIPMSQKFGWSLASIQVAFTLFVLIETWLVPVEGYLVDRFGPRVVVLGSSLLVAAAWVINSNASSLTMLYTGAIIGGVGAGGVYGSCVGNALKWFPDRRGLAAGLTAMGFGAGAALTVYPIARMIESQGYEAAFLKFVIAQGAVVFLIGWLLKKPDASVKLPAPTGAARATPAREYSPMEMLRSPAFWVMYVMFTFTAIGGLIATAQLKPVAGDLGITMNTQASILGMSVAALPFALSMTRVLNGISRPFFGWLSDLFGRENTMFVAFAVEALSFLLLAKFGANPVAFVFTASLMFFAYGEIYSLFPAAAADSYGKKFASANAGLLYTAKGMAALFVPLATLGAAKFGGWNTVFTIIAGLNIVAALLAIIGMKPLRARMVARAAPAPAPQGQLDVTA